MHNNLAIVIPAYKNKFLEQCLKSIQNQTNKNFKLYIGDDNSPDNFEGIVNRCTSGIDTEYHKFEDNLGGKNLTEHWNRCINLTKNESWIWLFSDDDIMNPECVESFYKTLDDTKGYFDAYRFNLEIIDEQNKVIVGKQNYETIESSRDYLNNRLSFRYYCVITNLIFRRTIYYETEKFENFDLAWCSDDAAWIKFSQKSGIYSINNASVLWRMSQLNISTNNTRLFLFRKIDAQLKFLNWIFGYINKNKLNINDIDMLSEDWFYKKISTDFTKLSINECLKIAFKSTKTWDRNMFYFFHKLMKQNKSTIGNYYNKIRFSTYNLRSKIWRLHIK